MNAQASLVGAPRRAAAAAPRDTEPSARRRHVLGVGALTTGLGTVGAVYALEQHRHLRTSSFDSVIFDQLVRAYSRFQAPLVPVKGVHSFGTPRFNELGDHFSPIMAVLGPVFRVWPHLQLLLVLQAVLFAAAAIPIWMFTRRALGTAPAYFVAAAYGLAWGLQSALQADVHEIMFAPLLIAVALERAQAHRPVPAGLAAAALLLVKEDLGLFVAGFGLYLAWLGWRRLGVATFLLGAAGFAVETQVLIPYFAGGHPYVYFTENPSGGGGVGSAGWYLLRHPLHTLRMLGSPWAKRDTLWWLTAPWAFLDLCSPIVLLAVPLVALRFLGTNPQWWDTLHQYNAELMPIVACAAVDGARRVLPPLRRLLAARLRIGWDRRPGVATVWAVGVAGAAIYSCTRFGYATLATRAEWAPDPLARAAAAAIATVPAGVTVEADFRVGPQLADRDTVWLLDRTPRWAPWVVADVAHREWPLPSAAAAAGRVALLERRGYTLVYDAGGFVVLHRS